MCEYRAVVAYGMMGAFRVKKDVIYANSLDEARKIAYKKFKDFPFVYAIEKDYVKYLYKATRLYLDSEYDKYYKIMDELKLHMC